jgi:hypothetical protein
MPTLRALLLIALSFAAAACGGDGDTPARPDAADDVEPDAALPPSCSDGVQGEDETDVDCGGGCGATCAIDDTCVDSEDCAADLVCDGVTEADDAPRGCRPRVDSCVGDPCDDDAYCAAWSIDPDTGAIYACSLRIPLGGECRPTGGTGDRAVNPCVDDAACAQDPDDPFAYVCITAQPEGAACQDYECADGLGCRGGTCTPLTPDGGSCLNTSECELDSYCAGPNGVCTPRVDAGAICYDLEDGCATGLDCVFPSGLACTNWLDCGSQMMCCGSIDGDAICVEDDGGPACEPPRGVCE